MPRKVIVIDYEKLRQSIHSELYNAYYRGDSYFSPYPTDERVQKLVDAFIEKHSGEVQELELANMELFV